MNTYILFADIGRAIIIAVISFFLVSIGFYLHAIYYNKTKIKAYEPLNPKEEMKAVLHPPLGAAISTFSLLVALGMADSLLGQLAIGLCYLVAFVVLFKIDRR